jgi:hypothetical protein
VEEPSADPSEREELEGNRDDGHDERSAILRDEEGQRVQNAAEEGSAAGNRAAQVGMLKPAPIAVASPAMKA